MIAKKETTEQPKKPNTGEVFDKDIIELVDNFLSQYAFIADASDADEIIYDFLGTLEREDPASQSFIDKKLPNRAKLLKIISQSKSFKVACQAAAEALIDGLQTAFENAQTDFKAAEEELKEQEKADREEEEREARENQEYEEKRKKKNAAKKKLLMTLSPEQRLAMEEAFDIAI
jgi:hypothetical protein